MALKLGTNSPEVLALQQQLNARGATRLPRLSEDNDFGPLTMARVMEFQFNAKFALAGMDGVVGPVTQAKLDGTPSSSPSPLGQVILADLMNGRLRAYRNGVLECDFSPIIGGSASDPSTRGVFKVYKAFRHHTSSKFPKPVGNMDFSLFFYGAEALHQGSPTVPSHGCIHVAPGQAERLFRWAGGTDATSGQAVNDVMVIVLKQT
ncbi:MAG: L,D-transpeptidase family protein [Burkholderiaceae bacterium]|nr:L,D-transpeptidase family protein [Burkholderiaceae bacterium]